MSSSASCRPRPDFARLLRALRYGGRAYRIECCGLRQRCRDRLCPACGKRWVAKHLEVSLERARALGDRTVVFATLKSKAATAHAAMMSHRRAFVRFRIRTSWPMLGAIHLQQVRGGWLAHTHVLIFGDGDPAALSAAVGKAWLAAGGKAWGEPARTIEGSLDYATRGALDTSWATNEGDLREWILATRGVRLVVRVRSADTKKRNIRSATHTNDPRTRQRIADRVLGIVREKPTAESAIRRALTSGDREVLREVIQELHGTGRIAHTPGKRGMRWTAAEDETPPSRLGGVA